MTDWAVIWGATVLAAAAWYCGKFKAAGFLSPLPPASQQSVYGNALTDRSLRRAFRYNRGGKIEGYPSSSV
jgi:hypothetical protein